jgi:hypothetical protein
MVKAYLKLHVCLVNKTRGSILICEAIPSMIPRNMNSTKKNLPCEMKNIPIFTTFNYWQCSTFIADSKPSKSKPPTFKIVPGYGWSWDPEAD